MRPTPEPSALVSESAFHRSMEVPCLVPCQGAGEGAGLGGSAKATDGSDVTAILTERGERYGKFRDHAGVSQRLKAVMRNHMGDRWTGLADDQKEALEMLAHKLARIANGDPDYADSWIDIAGYAQLVADRLGGVAR